MIKQDLLYEIPLKEDYNNYYYILYNKCEGINIYKNTHFHKD